MMAGVATPTSPVNAAEQGITTLATGRIVPLGIGKTIVVDLPREVKDVLIADPTIANAIVRSAQRAYIVGVKAGQTNIIFFDADGQQIMGYDLDVQPAKRDLSTVRAAVRQALPSANINVEDLGGSTSGFFASQGGLMLTGSVSSPIEAQMAAEIATKFVGDVNKVVNSIVVRGRDQVMLKVTVAEIQRDVIKQLGIDLNGSLNYGTAVLNFNNANTFPLNYGPLVETNKVTAGFKGVNATLRAMERAGISRTLAEPNLTAISGEGATFIAGGEFPVPKGYTCDPVTRSCQTQIEFKKFGISLNFTPTVMTEGRISLRLMNEVSELSSDNSITLTQSVSATQTNTLVVPSIKTRRAETTLEIPSGGSMAIAGLIHEQTKQQINGMPGLMQLPILGQLFKSRDYINRQTELVIIVTPYIVRAVAQKDLSRPDDGFTESADPDAALLSSFNKIYGVPGAVKPRETYRGKYGFILD
jgi:pilus assembly protein CpaC